MYISLTLVSPTNKQLNTLGRWDQEVYSEYTPVEQKKRQKQENDPMEASRI